MNSSLVKILIANITIYVIQLYYFVPFFVVLYININSIEAWISLGQASCLILFNNNEE